MLMDDRLYNDIRNALIEFEKEYEVTILIAGYGGSKSIGTDNSESDLDVYIIYDSSKNNLPKKLKWKNKAQNLEIHLIICSKKIIVENLLRYNSIEKKYPAYSFRTEAEKTENFNLSMYEREDYPRTLVYYTLMADVIWTLSFSIQDIYNIFKSGLCIADVCDFYLTKLWGNYDNYIINNDSITCRKYITVVWEILYCSWMVNRKTIPPMHLQSLLSAMDGYYRLPEEFEYAFKKNLDTSISKNHNMVICTSEFKNYVMENIKSITEKIKSCVNLFFECRKE